MLRLVLDANVLVSALISERGSPAVLVSYWQTEKIEVVYSAAILEELERVLHYDRLRRYYHLPEDDVQLFLRFFKSYAIEVMPVETVTIIEHDPTDNRYLECALAGHAPYLVSGDKHLLELQTFRDIQVLTPAECVTLIRLKEY
ncbi:MAG: putative toxin-antitoxin system toxin component, PIN family [Anaerolineae bacterium]